MLSSSFFRVTCDSLLYRESSRFSRSIRFLVIVWSGGPRSTNDDLRATATPPAEPDSPAGDKAGRAPKQTQTSPALFGRKGHGTGTGRAEQHSQTPRRVETTEQPPRGDPPCTPEPKLSPDARPIEAAGDCQNGGRVGVCDDGDARADSGDEKDEKRLGYGARAGQHAEADGQHAAGHHGAEAPPSGTLTG
ncbi:hypothetical protein XA68_13491 [Ophiocordyceps unilateralis]|uniref:Uncharacterized protein n=1 Tax=Ophiocordyceps unilateralis TaxID=268505 RepID=A0A2A9PAL8_OPHUN|nr:hypothetical protein XA68_13491 [Ophiocordyceps unilateralis]